MINWPERLFITGTDTDAGKSYATGWLARKIVAETGSCITQKFIQTGNDEYSEDIEVHRRIMGISPTPEDIDHTTAPVIFSYPASPHLSAMIDKREIDFNLIDRCSDILVKKYHHLLIEGAGGLMVPLTEDYLTIDYIKDHNLATILVSNGRLGSINHTLLALSAIERCGIRLFAVLYNTYFDSDKVIASETRKYIAGYLHKHFPTAHYLEM